MQEGVLGPLLRTLPLALQASRTALLHTAVRQRVSLSVALASTLEGVSYCQPSAPFPVGLGCWGSRLQGFLWTPLGLAEGLQSPGEQQMAMGAM